MQQIKKHLTQEIIPFWKGLRDDTYGGYYGYLGYDLVLNKRAVKGCILNSRILWFFSSAYMLLGDKELLDEAKHAYEFMKDYCIDKVNGGIYWSMQYDGEIFDSTKHTYNQAFAIYALSAYYEASGDDNALKLAMHLFDLIENKCKDEGGYLEAFDEQFVKIDNDKLSENGVMADRTMNTLLHVLEGYTELYRVSHKENVKKVLREILDLFSDKVYNPHLHRQEVFFDKDYNSLINLHSFGHDIETSWLIDRTVEIIDDGSLARRISPITSDLARNVYNTAFDGKSLSYECENGIVNEKRVWWVQAETVVGFINAYQKTKDNMYLEGAKSCLSFIFDNIIDKRDGSEWFSEVDKDGKSIPDLPIVEPWKCPYHNGRMCIEIIKRL